MAPPRRGRQKKHQPDAESGEEFRLSDVQSDSDVAINDPSLPSGSEPVQRLRTDDGPTNYLSGLDWHPDKDPEAKLKDDKSTAADIHYFFEKTKKASCCRICKKMRQLNPAAWDATVRYEYSGNTSNTSLRRHIEIIHFLLYQQLAEKYGWKIQLPGVMKSRSALTDGMDGPGSPVDRQSEDKFTERSFHEHLIKFIVADDQSLNVVECVEFRALLMLLRSDLKEAMIPHRTKLRTLIVEAWKRYFHVLKRDLANAMGQVSFTADIWSNQARVGYLAITAHWIARMEETKALHLKCALIAFHRLRKQHTGKSLARTVLHLLDRADITLKVGHFTLDNAENNTTFMEELARRLREREIPFDAKDRKIMCLPHVINICCGHVIRKFTNEELADDSEDSDDAYLYAEEAPSSRQTFEEAIKRDPIALGRSIVRVIRASGQRRDSFEDLISSGNEKSWFRRKNGDKETIVQLKSLQLLHDVRTRWDSVFYMLRRLREMRPAVDCFLALPNNQELAKYKLTSMEWSVLQDFEIILGVPHKVQQVMSAESTPVLSGVIPSFELFMSSWEKLKQEYPRLGNIIKVGLGSAYKYYGRMDRTKAYIIAMLINPAIRFSWIQKHWEDKYIKAAEDKIIETMTEYRARTSAQGPVGSPAAASSPALEQAPAFMELEEQYGLIDDEELGFAQSDDHSMRTVQQEYQAYITAPLSDRAMSIIKWWEYNGSAFPTLFAMAMDYLPIQASAVPCERVFSSSAETDTKKRNRISPLLMEVLQMLKFHLKKERLNFMEGWLTAEKEMSNIEPEEGLLQKLLDPSFQDAMEDVMESINSYED